MSHAGRSGLLLQQDAVQDEASREHDDQPHDGSPGAGRVEHPGQGSHATRGHEGAQAGGQAGLICANGSLYLFWERLGFVPIDVSYSVFLD